MANWIWGNETDNDSEQFVLFRRELELQKLPEEYWISVSADTRYKLFVNGVCCGFGPAKGNRAEWYLDNIDVAAYLKKGINVFAVMVLHYPLELTKGNRSMYRTKSPGLFIKGVTDRAFGTDASWLTCMEECRNIVVENPFFAPLQIYEEAAAESHLTGWMREGYPTENWEAAYVYPKEELDARLLPENLKERQFPMCYQKPQQFFGVVKCTSSRFAKEEWEAFLYGKRQLQIPADSVEIVELSAGELMCGFLSLSLCGGKHSRVNLLQSEGYVVSAPVQPRSYSELPVKGDRADSEHGFLYGNTDIYFPAGNGTDAVPEVYEPFWFRTFRYIRLEIRTENNPLILRSFTYRETGYPLEVTKPVQIEDPTMQKIWEISLRTLKRCMHDTYMDCPFYEQLQYAMDARSEILYTYAVSEDDRLARQCMDAFRFSQRPDGLLNCSAPDVGENVIPGFSIYYIGMIFDHMQYFGDIALVEKHLDVVEGILRFFREHLDVRGIVRQIGGLNDGRGFWSFIDWTKEWDATTGVPGAYRFGPVTMESFLYLYGLQMAAQLYRFVGQEKKSKDYGTQAELLKEAINCYCRDDEGFYLDGPDVHQLSQHCQVFAVLTDSVSVEEGAGLLKVTLDEAERFAQCSVAMKYYLFRALEKCGLYERTKELWKPWTNMIDQNLTTCAEDDLGGRSDCHAWGALALYEMRHISKPFF